MKTTQYLWISQFVCFLAIEEVCQFFGSPLCVYNDMFLQYQVEKLLQITQNKQTTHYVWVGVSSGYCC